MRTVSRALVRVINRSLEIDQFHFSYGEDDPQSRRTWNEGWTTLHEEFELPPDTDWLGEAMNKLSEHDGKFYGAYFRDGWLIMLRLDQVDPRRAQAHANDNDERRKAHIAN